MDDLGKAGPAAAGIRDAAAEAWRSVPGKRPMKGIIVGVVVLLAPAWQSAVPDLAREELATGPYARMHMLYERTIFNVDVLTVDMQFDEPAQRRFRQLAAGRRYAEDLAERIAMTAVEAEHVFVEVRFERDVALDRWVGGVRENLRKAHQWGVIDRETQRRVSEQLPHWFRTISERGFQEGDRILYRGRPDSLRTVLVGVEGGIFLDQTDSGRGPRRALLGGYFAPGSDFREPLIRSLLPEPDDASSPGWQDFAAIEKRVPRREGIR